MTRITDLTEQREAARDQRDSALAENRNLLEELTARDSQLSKLKASFDWHEAELREARVTGLDNLQDLAQTKIQLRQAEQKLDALSEDNRELQSGYDFLDELVDRLQAEIWSPHEPQDKPEEQGLVVSSALPGFKLRVSLTDGALDVEFAPADSPLDRLIDEDPGREATLAELLLPGLARPDTADEPELDEPEFLDYHLFADVPEED